MKKTDVIIIGSGIAALQLATHIDKDKNVIILTKSHLTESNSYKAQGGIACAIGKGDHFIKHLNDTLEAGRHLQDVEAVAMLTKAAPSILQSMIKEGCPFDKDSDGKVLLGREGAHHENRIVHGGGDQTGKIMIDHLTKKLSHNISVMENFFVFQLLIDKQSNTCFGIKGKYENNKTETIHADHIVLATGGAGQVYSFTSNALTATGDGIALAYQAGAALTDMEFVQFHPTLLYVNGVTKGLISEAVRGEGAKLLLEDGTKIMEGIHPLEDLAPRHIVSQTIFENLQNGKQVYLDISMIVDFEKRFPSISELCLSNGVSIEKGKIPVAPGSHFLMGGIKTDKNGCTNINRLYAIGEVACAGVHGANRLASNSLLEGLVFGRNLASFINRSENLVQQYEERSTPSLSSKTLLPSLRELQTRMMKNTGIVRSEESLKQQLEWLEKYKANTLLTKNLEHYSIKMVTKIFMLTTAWLITSAALQRKESRGGHYRSDFPLELEEWDQTHIVLDQNSRKEEYDEQIKAYATT